MTEATKTGPVGVGVIGAGNISTQYLTNLTAFPDVDVRFIADIIPEAAAPQAEKFGIPAHGTAEELLADPEIEIVVNLTLPQVHAEVDLQVLAAGKHVWSEKPIALDRESGQRVLATARARAPWPTAVPFRASTSAPWPRAVPLVATLSTWAPCPTAVPLSA